MNKSNCKSNSFIKEILYKFVAFTTLNAVVSLLAFMTVSSQQAFAENMSNTSARPYTTLEQWAATKWSNSYQPLFLNLFKLSWHDEFTHCDIGNDPRLADGKRSSITHRWYAEIRPARRAAMVGTAASPSPFSCSHGILSITLSNPTEKQWQGGELRAVSSLKKGYMFKYGYAEARIKFPKPPPGLVPWPAFWFLSVPPKELAQTRMELDVVEPGLTSSEDIEAQSTTIHEWPEEVPIGGAAIASHVFTGFRPAYNTFDGAWHTYGFEKLKTWWVVFRDGVEFGRYPVLGSEMDYPVYPLLDVALNFDASTAGAGSKYTMYVDYVRVYTPAKALADLQK